MRRARSRVNAMGVLWRGMTRAGSEKSQRFAAGPGAKAVFPRPRRDIDDMHRAIALAGDEEFAAAKRHVHRLAANLDGSLAAERGLDQADRVAVQAGHAQQAEVFAKARDLRGPCNAF